MTYQSKKLGNQGEKLALQHLPKKYKVLATNLRTKFGEIDILAQDGNVLVIVEVKTKSNDFFGHAIEMITATKRRKLILLAHELQMKHKTDSVRIDIVTIDNAESEPVIKHHKGMIECVF
ncbi:YraN family protein [Candidatus Berkelbacteria bacterium]|nr:YraN family protein [Candidatus Berkelbacteria bacterium]